MYIQCPQCRTLTDCSTISFSSAENQTKCQHCQAAINVPPALSAIFSNNSHQASAIPIDGFFTPEESSPIIPPGFSELHKNNQAPSQQSLNFSRWATAISGLLVIFILQYAYFMRDDLARHDVLRPWLEKLCSLAACKIPMKKDISKIILVNRDIRSSSDNKKILQVNITLKNIASHVQPFPKMQLGFYDINGNRIAYRLFNPGEYLSKQIDINKGMMPQVPVIASLQILDPGEHAITFEFEFF